MLSDAMNDLQEQVKVENVPAEKPEGGNGKPVSLALPHKFEFLINSCLIIFSEHRKLA